MRPSSTVVKLSFFVTDAPDKYAKVLVLGKAFQTSLMPASEA